MRAVELNKVSVLLIMFIALYAVKLTAYRSMNIINSSMA